MKAPCRGCEDRSPHCWDRCGRYAEMMEQINRAKAEMKRVQLLDDYESENQWKRKQ